MDNITLKGLKIKGRIRAAVASCLVVLGLVGVSHAQSNTAPAMITFQGRLTDNLNNPLGGSHNFIFKIFDNSTGAGTALWTETQNGVTVTNGALGVQLGAVTALSTTVFAGATTYLQITVDGTALSPLEQLVSVPYAMNSLMLGGKDYSGYVSTDTATQVVAGTKTFSGAVYVPYPSSASQAASKAYVDGATGAGAVLKTGDSMTGPLTMISGATITISGSRFSVGGSTLAVAGGFVGVGTSAPDALLHVAGQVKITGGVPGTGKVLTSDVNGLASWSAPATGDVSLASTQTFSGANTFVSSLTARSGGREIILSTSATAGVASVYVSTYGSVGIGTTNLASELDVRGELTIQNNVNPSSYELSFLGAGGTDIRSSNEMLFRPVGYLSLWPGNAEAMRLTTTGNVGIGTTNPGAILDVSGNAQFGSGINKSTFSVAGDLFMNSGSSITLSGANGFITSASSITASAFFGSGSALTGIPSTASISGTYVAKAGDAMTGPLTMLSGSTITVSGNAFSVGGSTFVVTGGRVGIGTTAPSYQLEVAQGINVNRDGVVTSGFINGITMAGWDAMGLLSSGNNMVLGGYRGSQWDAIRLYTSGSEKMRLDTNGRLGIGTTVPAASLDVNGNAQFGSGINKSTFSVAGDLFMNSGSSITLSGANGFITTASSINASAFFGSGAALTGIPSTASIAGTYVAKAGDGMTGPLTMLSGSTITVSGSAFSVGGSTLVVAGGKVGIGTTTPAYGLHLYDADDSPGRSTVHVQATSENAYVSLQSGADYALLVNKNDGTFRINHSGGSSDAHLVIRTTGQVGFGTSAPAAAVHISSAATAATTPILIVSSGTGAGQELLWIQKDGNVGLGTTSPAQRLEVNGNIVATWQQVNASRWIGEAGSGGAIGANTGFAGMEVESTVSGSGRNLYFHTNNPGVDSNRRMTVTHLGNVGIGTTSPTNRLDISGGGMILRSSMTMENMAAPPVSAAGQGSIYFDTTQNKFMVSQNAGAYYPLGGQTGGGWTEGSGLVQLSTPTDSVHIASTLTVAGNAFSVGGSTLVISGGRVGIGTTNPATILDVSGSAQFGSGGSKSTFTATGSLNVPYGVVSSTIVTVYAQVSSMTVTTSVNLKSIVNNEQATAITITGAPHASGTSGIPGGNVTVTGGSAASGNNNSGGDVTVQGGVSGANVGSYRGGNASLLGGNGNVRAGDATVSAGDSTGASFGGNLTLRSGAGGLDGTITIKIGNTTVATIPDNSGITMASGKSINLSGSAGAITTASSITASAFFGDGARLTGIPSTASLSGVYVAKGGDGMTGPLTMLSGSTITVSGNAFSVGGSTLVVAGGNVGIGTASPASKLHISSGTLMVDGNSTNSIVTRGRVGIGTMNPTADLEVSTVSGNGVAKFNLERIYFGNTGLGYGVFGRNSGGNDIYFGESSDAGKFVFRGLGALTVENNVGIGTTISSARLHVSSANALSTETILQVSSGASAGQELLVVKGDGKVGIGTTTPGALLDVALGTANNARFNSGTPANGYQIFTDNTNTAGSQRSAMAFRSNNVNRWIIGNDPVGDGTNNFFIYSANAPAGNRLVIQPIGNVGIGTTGPTHLLDVSGGLILRSSMTMASIAAPPVAAAGQGAIYFDTTQNKFMVSQNAGAYYPLGGQTGGGWTEGSGLVQLSTPTDSVHIASTLTVAGSAFSVGGSTFVVAGGKVGIGTSSPNIQVSVVGASTGELGISGGGGKQFAIYSGAGDATIYADTGNPAEGRTLHFARHGTGGGTMATFKNDGRVGVGTTSPAARLHVSSASALSTDTILQVSSGTSAGQELLVVKGDGKVGIGTSAPVYQLQVRGAPVGGAPTVSVQSNSPANTSYSAIVPMNSAGNGMYLTVGDASYSPASYFAKALWGTIAGTSGVNLRFGANTRSDDMVIDGVGSIGISTSAPISKLHVHDGDIRISTTAGAASKGLYFQDGTLQTTAFSGAGNFVLKAGDGMTGALTMLSGSTITVSGNAFSVGGATFAVMGGNVGLGTSAPSARLHVAGSAYFPLAGSEVLTFGTNALSHGIFNAPESFYFNIDSDATAGSNVFQIAGNRATTSGGNPYLTVVDDGNVGIGTSNPVTTLEVNGSAQFGSGVNKSTFSTTGALTMPDNIKLTLGSSGGETSITHDTPGVSALRFVQGGGEVMRMASSQITTLVAKFGIGTDLPATKLHMSSGTLTIDGNVANSIVTAGSVGIGTTSPSQKLQVKGNVLIDNTSWYYGLNTGGGAEPLIRSRGMGYDPATYSGVQIGQTGNNIALFIDPGSIAGGAFNGVTENELFLPNKVIFTQANAAGTDWMSAMILNNRNLTIPGGMILQSSMTMANMAAPPVSASGQGAIYFDTTLNKFMVSQNAGAYYPLGGQTGGGWTEGSGLVQLSTPTDSVHIASTLTVAGNAFSVGGSTFVVAGGKVGVGTSSPAAALDVIMPGNANVYENGVRANRPDSLGQYAFMGYAQASQDAYFGSVYTGAAGSYGQIRLMQYTQGMTAREALTINSPGNVGIGATAPSARLHVSSGSAAATDMILLVSSGMSAGQGLMVVKGDGKVGIGTTAPTRKLSIQGSDGNYDGIVFHGDDSSIKFTNAINGIQRGVIGHNFIDTSGYLGPANSLYLYGGPGNVVLNTAGSPILLQVSPAGGNVGIGTTAPGGRLEVKAAASDNNIVQISSQNGTAILTIQKNGYIGLGSASGSVSPPRLQFYSTNGNTSSYIEDDSLSQGAGSLSLAVGSSGLNFKTDGTTFNINQNGKPINWRVYSSASLNLRGNQGFGGDVVMDDQVTGAQVFHAYLDPASSPYAVLFTSAPVAIGGTIGMTPAARLEVKASAADNIIVKVSSQNGTGILVANSQGGVGIGTSNPAYRLDVQGDVRSTGVFIGNGSGLTNISASSLGGSATFSTVTLTENAFSVGTSTFVVSGGKVGIGTTNPAAKLHMSSGTLIIDGTAAEIILGKGDAVSTSRTTLRYQNGGYNQPLPSANNTLANGDKLVLWNDGSGKVAIGVGSSYNLQLQGTGGSIDFLTGSAGAAPTLRMRVNSVGAVGVGSVGAAYTGSVPLYISQGSAADADDVLVQGNTRSYITIESTATSATTYASLKLQNSGNAGRSWQIAATSSEQGQFYIANGNNVPASSSQFSILPTGEVGINKPIPAATLEVQSLAAPAAMALKISSQNASGMLVVRGDGAVGIGTASPLARLHAGDTLTDYSALSFTNTGAVIASVGADQDQARSNVLTLARTGIGSVRYAGAARFDMSKWASDGVNARTQLDIRLADTASDVLTDALSLRSNGNVGVGTTNPVDKLHMSTGTLRIDGLVTATTGLLLIAQPNNISRWSLNGASAGLGEYFLAEFNDNTGQSAMRISRGLAITAGGVTPSNVTIAAAKFGLATTAPATLFHMSSGVFTVDGAGAGISVGGSNFVASGGNVGIGTTGPAARMHVIAPITDSNALIIATGTAVSEQILRVSTDGIVFAAKGFTYGADLAEMYPSEEPAEAGDLMAVSPASGGDNSKPLVLKATFNRREALMGVVSTNPGTTLGWNRIDQNEQRGHVALGLAGRIPVKVTDENGRVRPGDFLTVSAIRPGYAAKAVTSGMVVGMALEAMKDGAAEGKVMTFVNLQNWVAPGEFESLREEIRSLRKTMRDGGR